MESRVVLTEDDVPGAKLSKQPDQCSVIVLKRWLECHGLKKGGNKSELVKRVEQSAGLIKVDPKVDAGKWYELKKNGRNHSLTTNDYTSNAMLEMLNPVGGWKNFPGTNIPIMFNYGHIYYYLVESVDGVYSSDEDEDYTEGEDDTTETVATAKPLRKGRWLKKSGFVENVQDGLTETGDYLLRAHVHHSMKSLLPLHVYVVVSGMSGNIRKCQCSCRVSEAARCAHIAALFLFLDDHIEENGYFVTAPSTSKPCNWNKGKKRDKNPKPLHKACYSSVKRSQSSLYNFDPRPIEMRGGNQQSINEFVSDQQVYATKHNACPMWLSIFKMKYDDFYVDEDYLTYLHEMQCQFASNFFKSYPDDNPYQIPGTDGQAGSDSWFAERRFRITASICKKVMMLGENIDPYQCYSWLNQSFWFKRNFSSADMRYGISEEPNAIACYSKVTGIEVVRSGLWVRREFMFLGASPDGLILDSFGRLRGIVEVKCLKALRTQTVKGWIASGIPSNACVKLIEGKLELKRGHSYFFQVHLQLLMTQAHYCDFVLHSKIGPPNIERIYSNVAVQKRIVSGVHAFWYRVFLPEYFLMRVPRELLPIMFK